MSMEIPLSKGKVAIIDDTDYDEVSKVKWHAVKSRRTYYAEGYLYPDGKKIKVSMHRYLAKPGCFDFVDHENHNGLDNRRSNLRVCTQAQNSINRLSSGVSQYRGVSPKKVKYTSKAGIVSEYNYWQASIQVDGKTKHLGYFDNEGDAATCYNNAAKEQYGEWAYLNDVSGK